MGTRDTYDPRDEITLNRKQQADQRRLEWLRWLPYLAVATVLGCLATGCQHTTHSVGSLPARMAAAPSHDIRAIDLSRLASADSSSERIYPGDSLDILIVTGAEDESTDPWTLTVSEAGSIDLPIVGTIELAGHTLADAEKAVRAASVSRRVYRDPTVAITVHERKTHRVTVTGAVEEPGVVEIPASGSDLLAAIVAAGGLTEAADRFVEIKRTPSLTGTMMANGPDGVQPASYVAGGQDSVTIDLIQAVAQPNVGGYHVGDGDVVVVREKPARYIHVLGLVNKPNQFEIPAHQNVTLLNAISMAGGITNSVADRVIIVRQIDKDQPPITISASIRKAKSDPQKNLLLADGDVVSVEETPATYVTTAAATLLRFGINGVTF